MNQASTVVSFLARTLATVPSGRSPRQSLLILAIIAAAMLIPLRRAFFDERPLVPGGHTIMSLDMAVNSRYCGKLGYVSHDKSLTEAIAADARLLHRRFPELLALVGASRDGYCATVTVPYLNNENALSLLIRGVLRLAPAITPHGLESALSAMRVALVLLFAYSLLEAGAGVPLVVGILLAVIGITLELWTFALSMYIFFIPFLLGACGGYAIAVRHCAGRSAWTLASISVAAGFATALAANMRSSHLPVYLAMFGVAAWAASRLHARAVPRWRFALVAVLGFALGYAAFGRVFIRPLLDVMPPGSRQFSYHAIGHPLVLGLAFPESDLSRREGIRWDDAVGGGIAQRMIPEAIYLGRYYEEAMLLYYLKLWLLYRGEMIEVYTAKLRMAATGMFAGGGVARAAVWRPSSGSMIVTVYAVATLIGIALFRRKAYPLALTLILIGIGSVLLFVESMLIVPYYHVQYHGFLLVSWLFLMLLVAQLGVDGALASLERRIRRPFPAPEEAA